MLFRSLSVAQGCGYSMEGRNHPFPSTSGKLRFVEEKLGWQRVGGGGYPVGTMCEQRHGYEMKEWKMFEIW